MSQETTNNAWLKLIETTMRYGQSIEVRGSEIKELINASITIDPLYPFNTFKMRAYNMKYCKMELLWKINADPFDTRIEKHAKMWSSVKNDDGSFNSNYGQYWFRHPGVDNAIQQLLVDKHTRRASIPMLAAEHVHASVRDTVCTEAMTFLIRKDKLNCYVHMRSSDQVFGLGTDLPSFAFVQRLVFAIVKMQYPEIEMGELTVTAVSSHIYERHFQVCEKLVDTAKPELLPMCNDFWMPIPSADEAEFIMQRHHLDLKSNDASRIRDGGGSLIRWLTSDGDL